MRQQNRFFPSCSHRRPGGLAMTVSRIGQMERGVPRNPGNLFARRLPHSQPQRLVPRKFQDLLNELFVGSCHVTRHPRHNQVARSAFVCHYGRNLRRRRFLHHVAERVRARRKHEHIHVRVCSRQFFTPQNPRENAVLQVPPQPLHLAAVAHHNDLEIRNPVQFHGSFDFTQEPYSFFRADAPHETKPQPFVIHGTALGVKLLPIHSSRHQKRRPSQLVFQPLHLRHRRCQGYCRESVKPQQNPQPAILHRRYDWPANCLRQEPDQLL